MSPDHDVVERFKRDLFTAAAVAAPAPRRRRWVIALSASATIAVLVLVAGPVTDDTRRPGPAGALAVTRTPEGTRVRIADATASPERIEGELRAAGIEASVAAVPVSPSLVGTWTSITAKPPLRDPGADHEGIGHGADLEVPRGYAGRLTLRVGRPAGPGEELRMSASAFAPGEPLHCSGVEQLDATRAARVLAERGLKPRWLELQRHRGVETRPGQRDRVITAIVPSPVDEPPTGRIVDARLLDRGYPDAFGRPDGRTVVVTVQPASIDVPPRAYRIPPQRC